MNTDVVMNTLVSEFQQGGIIMNEAMTVDEQIGELMKKLNSLPTMERTWCEKHMHAYLDGLPNAVDGSDPETFEEWRERVEG